MLDFSFDELWQSIVKLFQDIAYFFINLVIECIGAIISLAASMLPGWTPIGSMTIEDTYGLINALNWVFPVNTAVDMMILYGWSTVLYFTIGTVTRWAKVTGG